MGHEYVEFIAANGVALMIAAAAWAAVMICRMDP